MSPAPALSEDFRDFLAELVDAEVRFLLVGAHALGVHGLSRATGDLDVWIEPTPENAARAWAALNAFGAPLQAHGVAVEDLARERAVYQMGLPPQRIDVLTSIDGVGFEDAWCGRVEVELDGLTIGVLGIRQLRANKQAAGRPKDLLDLQLLAELHG